MSAGRDSSCFVFLYLLLPFETGSHCVAQVGFQIMVLSLPSKCYDVFKPSCCLKKCFYYMYLCMFLHVYGCTCLGVGVEVRCHPVEVRSPLLPCGLRERPSSSGLGAGSFTESSTPQRLPFKGLPMQCGGRAL